MAGCSARRLFRTVRFPGLGWSLLLHPAGEHPRGGAAREGRNFLLSPPPKPSSGTPPGETTNCNETWGRGALSNSTVPSRCSSGVPERCCSQQRCAELRAELHLRGCAAERLQLRTSIFACSPFRRFEKGRVFCHGRVCENQTTARGRLICLHSVRPLLLRPNGKERIIFVSGFSLFARV